MSPQASALFLHTWHAQWASQKRDHTKNIVYLDSNDGTEVLQLSTGWAEDSRIVAFDASIENVVQARSVAKRKHLEPPRMAFAAHTRDERLPLHNSSVDVFFCLLPFEVDDRTTQTRLLSDAHQALVTEGLILAYHSGPDTSGLIEAGFKVISAAPTPQDDTLFLLAGMKLTHTSRFEDPYGDGPLKNYFDAYNEPRAKPERLDPIILANSLRSGDDSYGIIDTRRADYKGMTVKNSVQVHAQRLPNQLDDLIALFGSKDAVVFYCGSSRGRGPRSAAFFQDRLNELALRQPRALVLDGGISRWQDIFGNDPTLTTLIAPLQ